MVYGGNGIGRLPQGKAVFVPYVLPGEVVKVSIIEEKSGFAIAELNEVLQLSAHRIKPRCRHFGVCGGCHYQHMPYELQLKYKQQILTEQLQRLGGVVQPPVTRIIASDAEWNYRNSVQFHLSKRGKLGYERFRSHDTLEIVECHLPCQSLAEIWPRLDFEPMKELDSLELRQGLNDDIQLILFSNNLTPLEFETELPISAVHFSPQGTMVLAGEEYVVQQVHEKNLRVSAGAFFQANNSITAKMVDLLLHKTNFTQGMVIMDIYCGVGLFSAFLAPLVKLCIGVESSPISCQNYACNLDAYPNVELYEGKAETILPLMDAKLDVTIVDPPRSGVDKTALDALIRLAPQEIIYISCNPATLARDARALCASGYALYETILLDMFPQTYHIESMNYFHKL